MSSWERPLVCVELNEKAEAAVLDPEFKHFVPIHQHVQEAIKMHQHVERKMKATKYNIGSGGGKFWSPAEAHMTTRPKSNAEAARRYFFDYNTVEMVLLLCAVLICLSGIMFESGRFEDQASLLYQRDIIAYIAIIVVVMSLVYYIIVFLSELGVNSFDRILQLCTKQKTGKEVNVFNDADFTMQENAMFATPGTTFGNTVELEKQLQATLSDLDAASQKNALLRDQVRKQKTEEQQSEINQANSGSQIANDGKKVRKAFGQSRA